ncbi:response regulator transcription factor [Vibrio sp. SCSIO 43136]|uniref:response regulator transcription factor n=1 Tax=Vibrio sp. SCSIO 43136 TaxID=2819101 RepID=UPI002075FE27|nr:response regulator transcription factor [Vibrio sp. SCSIO 43136]USD67440.1 response regulator transcription factor [Vibrio sp. SCSIO 43136]
MKTNLQLLLIEDDIDLATAVVDYLELENITCDHAASGTTGLNLIRAHCYDVIILDLNLPGMDGLEVCKVVRDDGNDVPILMLTARDTLDDKLTGFAQGADDYLIKPFEMEELIVRAQVLAKRRSGQMNKLKVSDLELNLKRQSATRANAHLKLSPTGFKILETLMRASPETVSRDKLISAVWGDETPDSNSLKVHMFNLRKQVDANFDHKLVHTVPGRGFAVRKEAQ